MGNAGSVPDPEEFRENATIVVVPFHTDQLAVEARVLSSTMVGQSGFSMVYKGRVKWAHRKYSNMVAFKFLREPLRDDQRKMYLREIAAIQHLSHAGHNRHILPFIGTATVGQYHGIISPFMANGNLLQFIENCKPFRVDRQRLLLQVAEALAYLHDEVGIVHGDIKCENILVSDSGNALLSDLGLSTLVEKDDASMTTRTSIRMWFSLRQAALELLTDSSQSASGRKRSKTTHTDVYAFGMLIVQAFTGSVPWPEYSDQAVIRNVYEHRPYPRPGESVTRLGLTDAWWAMCIKCWDPRPLERATMAEVVRELGDKRLPPNCKCRILPSRNIVYDSFAQNRSIRTSASVTAVAFFSDSRRILSGFWDGTIRVWDLSSGLTIAGPIEASSDAILDVAVSRDGKHVATCGRADAAIRRWEAATLYPIGMPMWGHSDTVWSLAYSPDGTQIASGSRDGTVCIWSSSIGEQCGEPLRRHSDWVYSVAYSLDGTRLASSSRDMTICIWNPIDGQRMFMLTGLHHPVLRVRFAETATRLVMALGDSTLRIWDISQTPGAEYPLKIDTQWQHSAMTVSWSGRYIAAASQSGRIRIWDSRSGRLTFVPSEGHAGTILALSFSPDEKFLLSGSWDGSMRAWSLFEWANSV